MTMAVESARIPAVAIMAEITVSTRKLVVSSDIPLASLTSSSVEMRFDSSASSASPASSASADMTASVEVMETKPLSPMPTSRRASVAASTLSTVA